MHGKRTLHRTSAWPAAVAVAVALVLAPPVEAESRTGNQECRSPTIKLTKPWRPARDPTYVESFGAFTPDFEVEPDERWEQLGQHRTSSVLEVRTEVNTRCDTKTCRTCVTRITARIGFTPSEIRLLKDLRRNNCAWRLVMLHEEQHEAVTRKAQVMAVEEAKRNLAWARHRHAAHVTPAAGQKAGQEEVMHKVQQDLTRALETAIEYSTSENTRIDLPEQYRRESRRQWRICHNR